MFKENREKIENGDVVTAVEIQEKLLKIAKDELKDDPGMMIYDSGCKPSFGNNYGTMFVSKGPVYNSAEGRFDIAEGSFIDGMQKRDVPIYGNGVINGSYP